MQKPTSYAQKVLDRYWDKQLPTNPAKIIENIIASQTNSDLVYTTEPMPDDISGKITFDRNKEKYTIKVNSTKPINHQRFILAHLLGHYAMSHGDKQDANIDIFSNGTADIDELEANAFATELIIPTVIVKKLIFEKRVTKIKYLSMIFNVSEHNMINRLENLGLIKR